MTAEWLRHYVYERIKPSKGRDTTLATLGTNLVSAFWHGFYPVYYNTFFFLAIIAEIGKDVYRLKHLFGFIPSFASGILRNLLIMTSLNYFATGMMLLELNKAYTYYKKYNFFMHITIIASFFLFRFVLLPMFGKKKNRKTKKDDKIEEKKKQQ